MKTKPRLRRKPKTPAIKPKFTKRIEELDLKELDLAHGGCGGPKGCNCNPP